MRKGVARLPRALICNFPRISSRHIEFFLRLLQFGRTSCEVPVREFAHALSSLVSTAITQSSCERTIYLRRNCKKCVCFWQRVRRPPGLQVRLSLSLSSGEPFAIRKKQTNQPHDPHPPATCLAPKSL